MTTKLVKTLENIATYVNKSNTDSMYFHIDNIIVRLSNHHSSTSDFDLAVYKIGSKYLCIPNKCTYKKLFTCTNVQQVVDVVYLISKAKELYTPATSMVKDNLLIESLKEKNIKMAPKIITTMRSLTEESVNVIMKYVNSNKVSNDTLLSHVVTLAGYSLKEQVRVVNKWLS